MFNAAPQIAIKSRNVFLIQGHEMREISDTVYLSSIPGMAESIREAANDPFENCVKLEDINWDEI